MTEMETGAPRGAGSPWKRFPARRRWGVAMPAIGAVVAGSLAFGLAGCASASAGGGGGGGSSSGSGSGSGGSGPGTTVVRHGEVWLQGEITRDACAMSRTHIPIGDVGCSITVNGYAVSVVHGNARLPGTPGTVTGLNVSTDQTGRHADVYAQLTGPHSASILSAPKYYARISG